MHMFDVCRLIYSDKKSYRYKTVDALIMHSSGQVALAYAVVYEQGKFHETHLYPCMPGVDPVEIRLKMQTLGALVGEPVEIVCVDGVSGAGLAKIVEHDFRDANRTDLVLFEQTLASCFAGLAHS